MANLFDPITLGIIEAKNRVFMAPLTRIRATKDHIPTSIMGEYYSQRASAGLIISEATGISTEGLGCPYAPGIWSQEQVDAWKPIVQAVHERGGKIVCQLWHMGRAVHSSVTGEQPVSSSETSYPTELHTYEGKRAAEKARELTKDDIQRIVNDYAVAAKNAVSAGFDGVQIHGANGYLIDQFLRDSANLRTDEYGGSVENRVRFLDEVVGAVVAAIGPERTGIRLSPNGNTQGVIDSDPEPLFKAAAEVLNKHNVAWLELREPTPQSTFGKSDQPPLHESIRKVFKSVLVLNQEYTRDSAEAAISSGAADAVAFGRPFITTPDLVEQMRNNVPISEDRNSSMPWWYIPAGAEGYTDLSVFNK